MKTQLTKIIKTIGTDKIVLLLAAGILMMLSFGMDKKPDEGSNAQSMQIGDKTENEYESQMEGRLKSTLESAYGTGNVVVMITMEESENKVIATLKDECIFDGNTPYVIRNEAPKVRGVVVVIKNNISSKAELEITQVCEVLLGVSSNKVKIISKK